MRNCFGTFISASARLVALPDRQLKFSCPATLQSSQPRDALVCAFVLHAGLDVARFGSFQAHVRHFRPHFYWFKSRLLCALSQEGEFILVLQAVAHVP